jgi:GntR family transcriptional regulator
MYGVLNGRHIPISLSVSSTNPEPMYRQIADQIARAIADGSLALGTWLPSIRETASVLQLSHITVKRAYKELERGGLIVTRPGLGSFVSDANRPDLLEQKVEEVKRELAKTITTAKAYGLPLGVVRRYVNELWQRRKVR